MLKLNGSNTIIQLEENSQVTILANSGVRVIVNSNGTVVSEVLNGKTLEAENQLKRKI